MAKRETATNGHAATLPGTIEAPRHRQDPLRSFKEAAAQIGVDERTVARWVNPLGRKKRLRSVRLPSGRRKIRQSTIDAILAGVADSSEPVETINEG